MSLVTDLLPTLEAARSIAGDLGLRSHTVTVLHGTWSGSHTGDGSETLTEYLIQENGQNPKVHWLDDERAALAAATIGTTVEIGPLTPSHSIGGVELATLTGSALSAGRTVHVRILGPAHPSPGTRYAIVGIRAESALHYTLQCKPA